MVLNFGIAIAFIVHKRPFNKDAFEGKFYDNSRIYGLCRKQNQ